MGDIRKGGAEYDGKVSMLAQALLTDQQKPIIFLGAGASVFPPAPTAAADGNGSRRESGPRARVSRPGEPVPAIDSAMGEPPPLTRLPTGGQLAREMATRIKMDLHGPIPLSTVAFYYESFRDRRGLNDWLVQRLDGENIEIPPAIDKLSELVALLQGRGIRHLLITTNYDRLFELAYQQRGLPRDQLAVLTYNGGNDPNRYDVRLHHGLDQETVQTWYPSKATTLYKLHGSITHLPDVEREGAVPEASRNLVVTEEDYINFLGNITHQDREKGLVQHISGRLGTSRILFIGYSLSDWNFRVIYKATAEKHKNENIAVQLFDHAARRSQTELDTWSALVEFWGKKGLKIINCDASTFLTDLVKAVGEARVPAGAAR
jgi:hypothetical protein